MSNPKISVIMPIYNVESYLDECLNSILNQSLIDDIEVIMVDDGSTDNSRYIIENYALDYDNFHAYHKENGGAGVARNYGMKFAKGDYIHFMDPDDFIDAGAYEKLYSLAVDNDADFVIANAVRYDRYKIWEDNLFKNSFDGLEEDIKIGSVNERISILWDTVLWNKLFKRQFVESNEISFPDANVIYQDIPFTLKSCILANSIYITCDVIYYWRLRKKSKSSTQLYENIKTFYDRIKILRICEDLMDELDADEEIRNYEYRKWLNHDLKLFLKRMTKFSEEYYDDIISNIGQIISNIPESFIDELSSYKKVMYRMVENNDLESLIEFSPLEQDLMMNPEIPQNLDDKYRRYIDFKRDGLSEELEAEKLNITNDEENIFIEFNAHINYIDDEYPHELNAFLIDGDKEYSLEITDNNITVPIVLLRDLKNRLFIKVKYISSEINKESLLLSHKRQIIRFDEFDLECGIGTNRIFSINVRKTNDNQIEIDEITFDDEEFKFKGHSSYNLDDIILENVLTFDRFTYPVEFADNQITFTIPYGDICSHPIRKWEIKSGSIFNSIRLPKKFGFFRNSNKIIFMNARNKILIEEDIYDRFEELDNLNEQLDESRLLNSSLIDLQEPLKVEYNSLNRENVRLNNRVEEFKSRKIVRIVDRIKN